MIILHQYHNGRDKSNQLPDQCVFIWVSLKIESDDMDKSLHAVSTVVIQGTEIENQRVLNGKKGKANQRCLRGMLNAVNWTIFPR